MRRFKRYAKKMQAIGYCCVSIVGLACMVTLPVSGKEPNQQYYQLIAGQETIGIYETEEKAVEDIVKARAKAAQERSEVFLSNLQYSIEKTDNVSFKDVSSEGSVDRLCKLLEKNAVDSKVSAYTMKINDFIVTLASKDDIIAVLDGVKNRFDTQQEYKCELTAQSSSKGNIITASIVRNEKEQTSAVVGMSFEESIEVVPAYVSQKEISAVSDAVVSLTKEQETSTTYQVQQGDCLSLIAQNFGMTTKRLMELNQLSDSEYVNTGDELLITVPEPILSVIVQEQKTYTEQYQTETVYKDNDSWYTTEQVVVDEGTVGVREVTAKVTYRNGSEQGKEIVQETLQQESRPKVIERGTQVPPTYIKPLTGGSFSSPFGVRWGKMHEGVDWSCPVGTAVKASCGGTVVSAGWQNGYGNCIVISHSDGKKTKYAHLSSILVSIGQKVAQGEKIALSGNTGRSTGPHLHFEIIVGGEPVDPLKYLN